MKAWIGCVILATSVFVGSALFSALRVVLYKLAGTETNMAPEMFVIFSPVLALPVAVVAVLIHAVFAKTFAFSSGWSWLLAGLAYSSLLLGLISPWLLLIPLVANPVTNLILLRLMKP
jgi:hypothetical protein